MFNIIIIFYWFYRCANGDAFNILFELYLSVFNKFELFIFKLSYLIGSVDSNLAIDWVLAPLNIFKLFLINCLIYALLGGQANVDAGNNFGMLLPIAKKSCCNISSPVNLLLGSVCSILVISDLLWSLIVMCSGNI